MAGWVAAFLVLVGCGSGTGTEAGDAGGAGAGDSGAKDRCSGIKCSGHGACAVVKGEPECACDDGYYPEGLNCLPFGEKDAGLEDAGDVGSKDAGSKDAETDAAADAAREDAGRDAGKHDASVDAYDDGGEEDGGEDASIPGDTGGEEDGGDGGDTGEPSCQHTCYPQGKIECIGTDGYRDCEDFNGDGCFEWSGKLACGSNATCINNACTCNSGYANCDSDWFTGCETNLSSDARHCGDCATDCDQHSVCSLKQCACEVGYGNCNTIWTDGCETDLTALTTCGTDCSTIVACSTYQGKDPVCDKGICRLTCENQPFQERYQDCNAQPGKSDGCEADITNDNDHCGGCGKPCDKPNMTCQGGACQCEVSFANCDRAESNGCETNLGSSFNHCGHCGCNCAAPQPSFCVYYGTCGVGNPPCSNCTNGRCYP